MRPSLNQFIEGVYFRGLVFNQSWEDPDLDRLALRIRPDEDTVLSVTSGGCNCLNLLCLQPRKLICVDVNPAQTYLLQLKLVGLTHLDHDDFFALFGTSGNPAAVPIYRRALRERLPVDARRYWDQNTRLLERGILTGGKLGLFLKLLRRFLHHQVGEPVLRRLVTAESLDEQCRIYYDEIQPRLWRGPLPKLLTLRPVLACAGMHPMQYELIRRQGGLEQYVRGRVEHLLTQVPIRGNYFVAQAVLGTYLDAAHVPPYLLESNFATLKKTAGRVVTVTARLGDYLSTLPDETIDRFNLLDVFDWMDPDAFRATAGEVIRVGSGSARFIYRSTVGALPLPAEYRDAAIGEDDFARELFTRDRSGTYSSFYVYQLKSRIAVANGA